MQSSRLYTKASENVEASAFPFKSDATSQYLVKVRPAVFFLAFESLVWSACEDL